MNQYFSMISKNHTRNVEAMREADRTGAILEAISLYKEIFDAVFSLESNRETEAYRLFKRLVFADLCHLDELYQQIEQMNSKGVLYPPPLDQSSRQSLDLTPWLEELPKLESLFHSYTHLAEHFSWKIPQVDRVKVSAEDPLACRKKWTQLIAGISTLWKAFNDRIKLCAYTVVSQELGTSSEGGEKIDLALLKQAAIAIENFLELDEQKKQKYEKIFREAMFQMAQSNRT
jgi:hypothetical protein